MSTLEIFAKIFYSFFLVEANYWFHTIESFVYKQVNVSSNLIFSVLYPNTLLLFYFTEKMLFMWTLSFILIFTICSTLLFSGLGTNFCYQTSIWYHSLMLHIIHFYQQDNVSILCTRNVLHCLCWVVLFSGCRIPLTGFL